MNFKSAVVLLISFFIQSSIMGQSENYIVKKTPFSTDKYDEFSPVCYKDKIVFCSNRPLSKVLKFSNDLNRNFFKINVVDTLGQGEYQTVRPFSKSLNTKLNDGPVTFSSTGDTIYFSRNIIVDGKLSDLSSARNKLGIFHAISSGDDWTKIREFRFNSELYNLTTPWITPDGQRLYFASDKPGGSGGSDIYYCNWKNDYWDEPVNMGPVINTTGNESYPFVNAAGEFFFSSDGHPGIGGKDIFFSRFTDTSWIEPICLDAPINSEYDDFGLFTDTLMLSGYFTSNRDKSLDIFHFNTIFPQIFYTDPQRENNYCFTFSDNKSIAIDSLTLLYRWSFGEGKPVTGSKVTHCFPGPGDYVVRLEIAERETGRLFFSKMIDNIELRDYEQPFIESPAFAVKGKNVIFDATKSYLPGFRILSYSWDFGDKTRTAGEKVTHSFSESGEYSVNLELALRSNSTRLVKKTGVSRNIHILNNDQESAALSSKSSSVKTLFPDISNSDNAKLKTQYLAESEAERDAVYCVELLTSKTKLGINNNIFRNIPDVYSVRERFDPQTGEYSYTVEQFLTLMSAYPTYRKMYSLGFKDVRVKMFVLTDASEKELYNLIRINGAFVDSYFDFANRLTSNALIMLDQIVKYMNKYPTVRLELAVHSDASGSPDSNKALSQKRSQLLVDYLINRGISAKRLVAKGYGGSKPIAGNSTEKDRSLNRRIDFTIINK